MQTKRRSLSINSLISKPTTLTLNGLASTEDFASVGSADDAVSLDIPAANHIPAAAAEKLAPEDYDQKLEALHGALLKFQKAMAAITPTDQHLRKGMQKAYEALLEVLRDTENA